MAKKLGIFTEVVTKWANGTRFYQMEQISDIPTRNIKDLTLEEIRDRFKLQDTSKKSFIDTFQNITYASKDQNIDSFRVYLVEYDEYRTKNAEYYAHEYDKHVAGLGIVKSLPFGMYTQELYAQDNRKYNVGGGNGEISDDSRAIYKTLKTANIEYNKTPKTVLLNTLIDRWDNGCGDKGYATFSKTSKTTIKYDETKFLRLI